MALAALRAKLLGLSLVLVASAVVVSCGEQPALTAPGDHPALSRGGTQGPDLSAALAAQERHSDRLLARPGVVGTAVGYGTNGLPVVKLYTARPGVAALPTTLDGVPVEIHVTGEISAVDPTVKPHARRVTPAATAVDATGSFPRPVPIGVSTGNGNEVFYRLFSCSSGTLAARLAGANGKLYALSNNHVYAIENVGQIGDPATQPGPADLGCFPDVSDEIGSLAAFVPINFKGGRTANRVDAAIAEVTAATVGTGTPADGYGSPGSAITVATVGLLVKKYGRTSNLTHGTVTGINAKVRVRYSSGIATFTGQIVIEGSNGSFSAPGDSGSLIVKDDASNNAVGLLFAGSSTVTVANPIGAVLQALGALPEVATTLTVDDGIP
jgi:hypothetical protein